MYGNPEYPWRLIDEVNNNPIFDKVKIGDNVAIRKHYESDWTQGYIRAIESYKNRDSRFQERPVLVIECHTTSTETIRVMEHTVADILFKD